MIMTSRMAFCHANATATGHHQSNTTGHLTTISHNSVHEELGVRRHGIVEIALQPKLPLEVVPNTHPVCYIKTGHPALSTLYHSTKWFHRSTLLGSKLKSEMVAKLVPQGPGRRSWEARVSVYALF